MESAAALINDYGFDPGGTEGRANGGTQSFQWPAVRPGYDFSKPGTDQQLGVRRAGQPSHGIVALRHVSKAINPVDLFFFCQGEWYRLIEFEAPHAIRVGRDECP